MTIKPKWTARKRVVVTIAIVIALVVTPQFVWVFMQAHAAEKTFDAFSKALVAKDYQRAYGLTSPEFQSATSEPDFARQQMALCSNLGDIEKIVRDSFETKKGQDGWSSDITARFVFKQGDREFDFAMKKQGTIWKVYGYRER